MRSYRHDPGFRRFEIELESDPVILTGEGYEAEDAMMKGTIHFHTDTPLTVPSVKILLTGEYCARYYRECTRTITIEQSGQFRKDEQILHHPSNSTLPAGEHSWPFTFTIPGHALHTMKGLSGSYYGYSLTAIIGRGAFSKDLKKRIIPNVIRTFASTSVALRQSTHVDRLWENKIKYLMSSPSKAIVYGSTIPVEFTLVPLMKGLKIHRISMFITEENRYHMKPDQHLIVPKEPYTYQNDVASEIWEVPEDISSEDVEGLEGYRFTRHIQSPRSLDQCRLSIEPEIPHDAHIQTFPIVKIKHYVRLVVALRNPDGHMSEIRAKLPIFLFLTQQQRLSSTGQLMNSGIIAMNSVDIIESEFAAPPAYGQHEDDEALNARDIPASGSATPLDYLSSRNSSVNLDELASREHQQLVANTLHNRLSSVVNGDDRFATSRNNSYSSMTSRASSYDGRIPSGVQTPAHIEYDSDALSRVPSYNTASGRDNLPRSESHVGLPTYQYILNTCTHNEDVGMGGYFSSRRGSSPVVSSG